MIDYHCKPNHASIDTDNSRYALEGDGYHSLAHRTDCKELRTLRPFDTPRLQRVVGREEEGVGGGEDMNDEGGVLAQSVNRGRRTPSEEETIAGHMPPRGSALKGSS